MLKIRRAEQSDMDWVNKCYDEADFVHSHFENEIIAIAEYSGMKAGLGRLVTLDDHNLELGGMFVLDAFRGKGIARAIVYYLLEQIHSAKTIYCIPFEHLLSFYKECGFISCKDASKAPPKLLDKYHWCKAKYNQPTALLQLAKD